MRLKKVLVLGGIAFVASWVMDEMRRKESDGRGAGRDRVSEPNENGRLTAALENTFPASDPYQVGNPTAHQADRPMHRRPAAIDPRSVERQVDLLERKRSSLWK